jgi:SAM-dependent methyltransferase
VIELDERAAAIQAAARRAGITAGPWSSLASARQYRRLLWLVATFVRDGGRVLDWGAGQGFHSLWLSDEGYEVAACDVHPPKLLPELERRPGYEFRLLDDPVRLPFPDESFDAVTSIGVLEHVVETGGSEAASVAEIRRVLRPDGVLICVHLPNAGGWVESLIRLAGLRRHLHTVRYRRSDIEALCSDAGLDLVTVSRYGLVPRNSFTKLPPRLRASSGLATAIDAVDSGLGRVAQPVVQNWAFVARRRT